MAAFQSWVYSAALQKIEEAGQNKKTSLVLERLGLDHLPAQLFELENLEELVVIDNLLTSLPADIANLRQLTHLDLFYNELELLPPEIGSLNNLTHLDLSCNNIAYLPKEIIQLKNLRYLDLRDNPIPIPAAVLEQVNDPQLILSYLAELEPVLVLA